MTGTAPFNPYRFPIAAAALGLEDWARDAFAQRMASLRDRATPAVAERAAKGFRR